MEDHQSSSKSILHDMHLASRKAEEIALRRYQAAGWLESFVGSVGGLSWPNQPSEVEFVSCLKNGLVLCNLINKIQPGSVPKVIENSSSTSLASILDGGGVQPLLAYQYFENVRNFLVAVKELNIPAFDASDLEMVSLEGGSSAKIVDCVLALKMYHEWKQWKGDTSGFHNHTCAAGSSRSPMVPLLAGNSRNLSHTASGTPSGPRWQLDMSPFVTDDETSSTEVQNCKTDEDSLVGGLAQCLVNMKENIDQNLLNSFHHGNLDSVKFFSQIMPNYLQEQVNQVPEACIKTGKYKQQLLLKAQEKELMDLKKLLTSTNKEVEVLQVQFQSDLQQIESQVQGLASAALGYGRVVKENRDLSNMVQDLKETESFGETNKENNEVRELKKQVEILKASLARKDEQTVKHNQVKELESPRQTTSKVMTEKTPPRSRRLSIESCSAVKTEKVTNSGNRKGLERTVAKTKPGAECVMTEKTPPRSRRLSIESCSALKTEKVTDSGNRKGLERTVAKTKPGVECVMAEKTPPRSRRLSIESCSAVKTEKVTNSGNRKGLERTVAKMKPGVECVMTEKTPPRSRRLSIESCSAVKTEKVTKSGNMRGLERTVAKMKPGVECAMTEKSPPRSRRLSIESYTSVKAEKVANSENREGSEKTVAKTKLGIECTPMRFRRLSLEGPTYVKDHPQFKTSENEVCATIQCQQNRETNSNYRDERFLAEDYHINFAASQSSTSGAFKKEGKERTHPVQQLLKTPERATCGKTLVQIVNPSDFGFSNSKYQTPKVASRKPSQIRKSIQTIGKFISGSERRNQQEYPKETQLPRFDNVKSPSTASSRPLRRQSLTGTQISGVSRISSLVGNETRRNAVTPPPMHFLDHQ